jgi:small subunit ribosomal protein S21
MKNYNNSSYDKNNKRAELEFSPLEVKINGPRREEFEDAFRKFKAKVQKEKILSEYKDRQSYEKPSERRRRKRREALERRLSTEARQRQILTGEWDKRQKLKQNKKAKGRSNENDMDNSSFNSNEDMLY